MSHIDCAEALASFIDEGLISEVLFEVKSGKEATVHCCRGGPALRGDLIAAKIYRPLESRRFRNDAIYQEGRVHLARDSRVRRAAQSKSRFGHAVQYAMWLEHEWETMNVLFEAGADVPEPIARNDRALLMPFIGDERGPAPILHEVRLDRDRAAALLERLLWNVELMLDHDRVHGDLSPFNILYEADGTRRATIIDLPQAVDPRLNRAGRTLLARDVENLCRWARRHGVDRPAARLTDHLWSRFVIGELG